uniref:Uncharacterized protein n=1 Tax=Rhizophora mucronata TaxID=61149 RepID=A0A2P2IRC5_RHIMU
MHAALGAMLRGCERWRKGGIHVKLIPKLMPFSTNVTSYECDIFPHTFLE